MPPEDENEIYPEWITFTSKRVEWREAMETLGLMKAYREERAAEVAKRLLGNPNGVPTAYEMEPIGANRAMEAVASYHFCRESCRDRWVRSQPDIYSTGTGLHADLLDGEICEECGNPFDRGSNA